MRGLQDVEVQLTEHDVGGLYVRELASPDGPVHARPLVMVHGRCHGAWAYGRWQSYFASSGWRTFSMSLRGHRGSEPLPTDRLLATSLEDYVDDVTSVLLWLEEPAVVIGHSLGGIVAQVVAMESVVAGLVLVASVGPSQLGRHAEDFPVDRVVDDRDEYRARGELEIVRRLGPESPTALNQVRGRTPIDRSRVTCPVLAVGGELDATGVHPAARLADFYQADFVDVPGAGHDLMFDRTSLLGAAAVQHWLLDTYPPVPRSSAHPTSGALRLH